MFSQLKFALCFGVAVATVAPASAALQNDVRDKDGNYLMLIRPVNSNGWSSARRLLPPATTCVIDKKVWRNVCRLFVEASEVIRRVKVRQAAYHKYLDAMGREELPMSVSAVRTEMIMYNDEYFFDRYGHLFVDGRFVLPRETPVILRLEKFYKDVYEKSELHTVSTNGAELINRAEERRVAKIQTFRGFEDDRYQRHDELIVRCVNDFNNNRGIWAGSTDAQARRIHDLTPELVKSHMIEETGGHDRRSSAAWRVDPLQVNVPGDWNPWKTDLGLFEPVHRNEGTPEQNVVAAIRYLTRKGFGVAGQPAKNRPSGSFDGWYTALRRYNGRNDETLDGRRYKDAYAERISKRAEEPDAFVPISIPTKKHAKKK